MQNTSVGKVERHEFETVFGNQCEVQARKTNEGYRAEWSFDGHKWNCHLKTYPTADEAILMARCGAFISHVHNKVLRRKDQ